MAKGRFGAKFMVCWLPAVSACVLVLTLGSCPPRLGLAPSQETWLAAGSCQNLLSVTCDDLSCAISFLYFFIFTDRTPLLWWDTAG